MNNLKDSKNIKLGLKKHNDNSLHCNFINDTHIGASSVSFSPIEQFVKKALQQVTSL